MKFKVSPMTCGHCVHTITRALQSVDPDARVNVDLSAGTVDVAGRMSPARAVEAMEGQGYAATLIEAPEAQETSPGTCCGVCHA